MKHHVPYSLILDWSDLVKLESYCYVHVAILDCFSNMIALADHPGLSLAWITNNVFGGLVSCHL